MTEILACRGCRRALTEDAGCELCLGVKRHLIVAAQADEDNVPLAVVASEAVTLLRTQLTRARNMQKASSTYDPLLAGEARAIANVLAKLLDSARKVVQDGSDAVTAMSFQEKAALFLEWTRSLPGPYRRRLIESLIAQGSEHPPQEHPVAVH